MTPPPAAAFAPPLQRPRARPQRAPSRRPPSHRPRRVSGPTRAPARVRSLPAAPAGGVALRAIGVYDSVSTSAFLDRLVRGRLWIGMLACALVGVVALQLVVLNLNTGIGRKLARVALLQRENAQLGIEDAGALGEARIEPLAAAAGMTFAPSGSAHFVAASPSDVGRAAASLSTPVQAQTRSAASLSTSEATSGLAAPSGTETSATPGEAQSATGSSATQSSEATKAASSGTGEASGGTGTSAAAAGSGGESPGGASGATQGGASASPSSEGSTASSSAATGGGVAAGHG